MKDKLRRESGNPPRITEFKKSFVIEFPDDEHRPPILHLQGTHYEMGYAFGMLYAEKIKRYLSEFGGPVAAMFGGWQPGSGDPTLNQMKQGLEALHSIAEQRTIPVLRDSEPQYWEEVEGVYDALQHAGSPLTWNDVVLLANAGEASWNSEGPQHLCSNFAAWGKATKDGKLVHGVNLDYEAFGVLQDHISVMVRKPAGTGENAVIGLCHNGMLAPYTWMNDKGLSYGELDENTLHYSWPTLPHLWRGMKIAHNASTIEEAYEIVKKTGGSTGHSLLISQANKHGTYAADIEITGTERAIRHENPDLPNVLFQTNIFRCVPGYPGYEGDENLFEGQMKYIEKILPQRPDHFIDQSTTWEDVKTLATFREKVRCPRYTRYEEFFRDIHGQIDLEQAIRIQSDPALTTDRMKGRQPLTGKVPHLFGIEREIVLEYLWSVYCAVLLPGEGTLWIAVGEKPAQKGPFWYVNLNEQLEMMKKYENN